MSFATSISAQTLAAWSRNVMAYLPAQKISIVATTTLWPAPPEGNMPEQLFWHIAQRLAPAHAP